MDKSSNLPARSGGTIEPIEQRTLADGRPRLAMQDSPGRTYERYDPFVNVMHRAKTFDEMVVNAERAKAVRFSAVDADGSRTPVQKVGGGWRVPAPQALLPFPDPATSVDLRRNLHLHAARLRAERESASWDNQQVLRDPRPARQATSAVEEAERRHAVDVGRIQASLHERYDIKRAMVSIGGEQVGRTEYRVGGGQGEIAFTESDALLSTGTSSVAAARSMVDVAQARSWRSLRVSGADDFRRAVWREATGRGLRTVGYEPAPADFNRLRMGGAARLGHGVEQQGPVSATEAQHAPAGKRSARGENANKAVLGAIEALLVERKVPQEQREAVMAAASEELAKRTVPSKAQEVKTRDVETPSGQSLNVYSSETVSRLDLGQTSRSR